ncbi:histidine phosphatase family protein [Microbacterium kribbense]|uniref:Histidine phosphatase family protein n=1 Tax=Microbacterium kribbense TaxID=433645 RepID=A0ABP7G1I3_9MICO
MRLVLIRHGQTPSNVRGLLDTRLPGPGLTRLGLQQAAALPDALAGEDISAIYVSNMVRTQLTAAYLAADLDLETVERAGVREITSGDLEMRSDRASVERYLATVYDWTLGDLDRRMPGGESGAEFFDRYDEVIAEAAQSGHSTVAIVSHGAAIRAWSSLRGSNLPSDFIMHNPLHNTGIVIAEGEPGGSWDILSFMGDAIGGERVDSAVAGPAGQGMPGA